MTGNAKDSVNQALDEWLASEPNPIRDEKSYIDAFNEAVSNGESIDWDYWSGLSNIAPAQAARLYWCIDPIKWPGDIYKQGRLPDDLQEKILRLKQWLEGRGANWSLNELANALGLKNLPFGMAEAVKKQRIDEVSKHSFDIQPLEPLTDEIKQDYYSRAAWSWVDAIYILQGYKPVFQLSTEQVRSHFPSQVAFFTQSIQLGNIGKAIIEAEVKTFIDSPANWQAFWQNDYLAKKEPKAGAIDKLSLDNELDAIFDTSLHNTLNELKQRNEAPYDGVLGTPPSSVTENELERFISIRNRLLDGEGFTEADIRGLINDCDANTHSFSLISDRLKQDIRFLASLWRAAKKNKPKAEALLNDGVGSKENTNDIAASSLLKLPARQDAWVDVISDMTTAFHAEFGKLPNESQAWGCLWTKPPAGYAIKNGTDKGEDCLTMPGEGHLSKSGFSKRWKKYSQ